MFIETIINGISTIAGVVIGALIAQLMFRKNSKRDELFAFHKEFFSREMALERSRADKLIKLYPNKKINEIELIDWDGAMSLYIIMRFYERLWLHIKYENVQNHLVCELFSEKFYFWYYIYFQHNMDCHPHEKTQLKEFDGWLETHNGFLHKKKKAEYLKLLDERKNWKH